MSTLKGELRKSRLNLARIREMLAFVGDVDGTLGVAGRVANWYAELKPYIEALLASLTSG